MIRKIGQAFVLDTAHTTYAFSIRILDSISYLSVAALSNSLRSSKKGLAILFLFFKAFAKFQKAF
jgi:hypothetical protein